MISFIYTSLTSRSWKRHHHVVHIRLIHLVPILSEDDFVNRWTTTSAFTFSNCDWTYLSNSSGCMWSYLNPILPLVSVAQQRHEGSRRAETREFQVVLYTCRSAQVIWSAYSYVCTSASAVRPQLVPLGVPHSSSILLGACRGQRWKATQAFGSPRLTESAASPLPIYRCPSFCRKFLSWVYMPK